MRKAFQVQVHVVVPCGISNDSPDVAEIAVVSRDDVQRVGFSRVFAQSHHVWSWLNSIFRYGPLSCVELLILRRYYDRSFVSMIGKDLDKLPFLVKEEWVWSSVWIGIAIVIYCSQQQLLWHMIRLKTGVTNRA